MANHKSVSPRSNGATYEPKHGQIETDWERSRRKPIRREFYRTMSVDEVFALERFETDPCDDSEVNCDEDGS